MTTQTTTAPIVEKIEKLLTAEDCPDCYATEQSIIDLIHPMTGLTVYSGETLEEIRKRYPTAERLTVEEFCTRKAKAQRTPITWGPTTKENYYEMQDVLPPAAYRGNAFLVGEPCDHDAGNGQPRFRAFRYYGEVYEVASRPMTIKELEKEVKS